MNVAQGALRHGLLYELLERDEGVADLRSGTVARLATRFGTDPAQARRVGRGRDRPLPAARAGGARCQHHQPRRPTLRKLDWASQLHEIGAQISHSDYHKHGAYILDNADVPGFATNELHWLSQLVLGHRGKLRKLGTALEEEALVRPLLALRLAVILCHARRDQDPDALRLSAAGPRLFRLSCAADWVEAYPQSAYLLGEEVVAWQKTPWSVELRVV